MRKIRTVEVDGQTDGRTPGRIMYRAVQSMCVACASRGKNADDVSVVVRVRRQ